MKRNSVDIDLRIIPELNERLEYFARKEQRLRTFILRRALENEIKRLTAQEAAEKA